jgi:hypothetical protein
VPQQSNCNHTVRRLNFSLHPSYALFRQSCADSTLFTMMSTFNQMSRRGCGIFQHPVVPALSISRTPIA